MNNYHYLCTMIIKEPEYINVFSDDLLLKKTETPLFEMAEELKHFKLSMRGFAGELINHIIYVCVLGNRLSYVEHWKHEILLMTKPVIDTKLKKSADKTDRAALVRTLMMQPQMGENFEDYDAGLFEDALDNEIRNGEKMFREATDATFRSRVKQQLDIIKDVRSNLDGIPEKCRPVIEAFYSKFCEAAEHRDAVLLEDAINNLEPVV